METDDDRLISACQQKGTATLLNLWLTTRTRYQYFHVVTLCMCRWLQFWARVLWVGKDRVISLSVAFKQWLHTKLVHWTSLRQSLHRYTECRKCKFNYFSIFSENWILVCSLVVCIAHREDCSLSNSFWSTPLKSNCRQDDYVVRARSNCTIFTVAH